MISDIGRCYAQKKNGKYKKCAINKCKACRLVTCKKIVSRTFVVNSTNYSINIRIGNVLFLSALVDASSLKLFAFTKILILIKNLNVGVLKEIAN